MMNQEEMSQREVMNKDPAFSLRILRFRHGMMIVFLVVGVAALIGLCILVITGRGSSPPSSQLYAGVFLVLWNAVVLAMLRHSSAAMANIRREAESINRLR